jgi:PhnB protein
MVQLIPFLLFDGKCGEAMKFYQACLGGELTLIRLGDTPMKAGFPESQHDKVTYAHLKGPHAELSGTDWLHPTERPVVGNTAAMQIRGDQREEVASIFRKLSQGAERENFVELREMPFGLYGRLTDRYGFAWFFRGPPAGG